MARRFVGERVFGESSEDQLFIERATSDLVRVIYQPSQAKLEESERFSSRKTHGNTRRTLLEIGGPKQHFCIFPLNTLQTHDEFLQAKYERIERIILEGFDFELPSSVDEVRESREQFPTLDGIK